MSEPDRPSILVPMTAGRRARAAATTHKPQPMLFDLGPMSAGYVLGPDGGVRKSDDYYATPAWCTDAILPELPVGGDIVEPSCGDGAILARVALVSPARSKLWGFELHARRAETARLTVPRATIWTTDFLHWAEYESLGDAASVGLVIGNPPFALASEFCEACIRLAAPTRATVAMLLRLSFAESEERADFHEAFPADVYPLASRPSFTGDGTDSSAYAWWCWGPGRGGRMFPPLRSGGAR